MITFKSIDDLSKLSISSNAYPLAKETFEQLVSAYTASGHPYRSDEHGYVVLVEESDLVTALDLPELNHLLIDMPWEGVTLKHGFFYGVVLIDNECGISFLIQDAPWLDGELRKSLEAQLNA